MLSHIAVQKASGCFTAPAARRLGTTLVRRSLGRLSVTPRTDFTCRIRGRRHGTTFMCVGYAVGITLRPPVCLYCAYGATTWNDVKCAARSVGFPSRPGHAAYGGGRDANAYRDPLRSLRRLAARALDLRSARFPSELCSSTHFPIERRTS